MTICQYEGCDRGVRSKGYCTTHYRQQAAGEPLKPIKTHLRLDDPVPGKKICTRCLVVKDKDTEFYARTMNGRWYITPTCKVCVRATSNATKQRLKDGDTHPV